MDADDKWIIDTDPGCDDMVAILYLLTKLKGKVELISITQGNCTMPDATKNIRRILSFMEYRPLVMCGCKPIWQGSIHCYGFHKDDGLGNIKEFQDIDFSTVPVTEGNSALKMIEICKKFPGKVNIFTIGPVTNLAIAYMLNPEIANLVKSFYVMGGSTHARGNNKCLAEMNFGFDPISTKIVLSNFKNLVICSWECCEPIKIPSFDLEQMKETALGTGKAKLNEKVYEAIFKVLKVFDNEEGGLDICDLYALIICFEKKAARGFSVCLLDSTIDLSVPFGNGMFLARKLKLSKGDLESTEKHLKEKNLDKYHLVVNDLEPLLVKKEFCSIFLDWK
jgi:purine nucleosidase